MASTSVWISALRPKTLPAGAVPVILGSALALADGQFSLWNGVAALVCSLLMQIASNFFNEIYDFRRGADSAHRVGPRRAVAAGLITEKEMTVAAIVAVSAAFLIGLYLTTTAGWGIFAVGAVSLVMAWAYTGGKYPLAYLGLGEVFAFVFFGVIATCGTYVIHAHNLSASAIWLSLAPAAFSANILNVNNIRDVDTDREAGKRTLSVRFGTKAMRFAYAACMIIPFLLPFVLFAYGYSGYVFLTVTVLPMAVRLVVGVYRNNGTALNSILAGTGVLMTFYCALMVIGLLLG